MDPTKETGKKMKIETRKKSKMIQRRRLEI